MHADFTTVFLECEDPVKIYRKKFEYCSREVIFPEIPCLSGNSIAIRPGFAPIFTVQYLIASLSSRKARHRNLLLHWTPTHFRAFARGAA